MFGLIERYINNLTIHDLNNLAITKEIYLSQEELEFSYDFVKKNWQNVLANHCVFDVDKYKEHYSEENFMKIKKLIKEYSIKYGNYL